MSAELEQSYFIYWKGRQSGPFSERELREMLEREEISLAHQVFHQGRQTSLSEFLQQKREASARQIGASASEETTVNTASNKESVLPQKPTESASSSRMNTQAPSEQTEGHVPPIPWLRLTTFALIVFSIYSFTHGRWPSAERESSTQKCTFDVWVEKSRIDKKHNAIIDPFTRSDQLAADYSRLKVDAVDPILASHLQSAIKMHTTGAQILKEVIFESRKIHPEIAENEIVKNFLSSLKAMPRSSSPTDHAASAGIPGLDAAALAPEPFAKQLSACLKWERDLAAHAIQAKDVSALLSKKYSVKFSPNPESNDP